MSNYLRFNPACFEKCPILKSPRLHDAMLAEIGRQACASGEETEASPNLDLAGVRSAIERGIHEYVPSGFSAEANCPGPVDSACGRHTRKLPS